MTSTTGTGDTAIRNPAELLPKTLGSRHEVGIEVGISASTSDASPGGDDFRLESPEASKSKTGPKTKTPTPKSGGKPKTQKTPKSPTEETTGFLAVRNAYFEAFESARGEKPLFDSADGRAIHRLIDKCAGDATRAVGIIRKVYAPGSWWRDKATIRTIATDPQKCTSPASSPNARPGSGRGPAQPSSGYTARLLAEMKKQQPPPPTGTETK